MTSRKDAGDADWSIEDTIKAKVRLHQGQPVSRFDPYQGVMSAKQPSRKKDLRKLGEWLELKRRAEKNKKDDAGGS
jgi:hypothetical protein